MGNPNKPALNWSCNIKLFTDQLRVVTCNGQV